MSENKKSDSTTNVNESKKYKKYFKLVIYIILILFLLFILAFVYLRVKRFIDSHSVHFEHNNVKYETSKVLSQEKIDSINTCDLEKLLQNQQAFQKEVYQKFDELNHKINILHSNKCDYIAEAKTIISDGKMCNSSKKNDNCKDLNIVFNLIMDLNTNKPFLTDLEAFYNSVLLEKNPDITVLYEVSAKGIPTSYDLATSFEVLQPNIKREIYSKGVGWLNKAKYYLSFFIVVQKECALSCNDNTLDSHLSKIKQLLIEDKPEYVIKIVDENNLSQLTVLSIWYKDLTYRVKAKAFALKLKQYFLNS